MKKDIGLKNLSIFGIPICISSRQVILDVLETDLSTSGQCVTLFTPNPEILVKACEEERLKKIVTKGKINIPDGVGVTWAISYLYGLSVSRISGADLMADLCAIAEKRGYRIGLIGGGSGVALDALECLIHAYPRLDATVLSHADRMITIDDARLSGDREADAFLHDLYTEIIDKRVQIVFFAYGCPKQEYIIETLHARFLKEHPDRSVILMAVGGTFDYLSGRVSRAPVWMRSSGLEWLYRLVREPWRWKRQSIGAKFFWHVIRS